MKNLATERILIPLSFAIIYIIWGSTYLANWYAIRDIPTFLMCGSRFFVAGLVLFAISSWLGTGWPTRAHWKSAALMGFFFFFIGNGGAVWALNYIDSGIEALLIASQPLVTVLMMWAMIQKKPSLKTFIGIIIGMAGMALLVGQDQFTSSPDMLLGIAMIIVCVVGWAYATIKITQIPLPESKIQSAAIQMIMGGAMLLAFSFVTGDAFRLDVDKITQRGVFSWFYLMVFGSVVAFSAFNYLLLKTTPDKVATSTYVNPIVALFLGWGLNNEKISTQSFLAAALLLAGVIFINTSKGLLKRRKLKLMVNGK